MADLVIPSVQGEIQRVFYDKALLDVLFQPSPFFERPYRSNWRILHVDGFEGFKNKLTLCRGRLLRFFEYSEFARTYGYDSDSWES